ncbi:alpha-1,3-mannosyl-glycoprotein beta-1,2-N-acetylglucosaminyltransferase [Fistulifera solaris]|uniref:alpha-1,3-mannosyl-glycoprotein 2-beta-N-acetylglucosaminyltransferase n=1 Tax=Fistulifera solaris TaxID=1519565 RepID=A0A1Z5JI15_FISSO|nr:alpha-1,3-mannosyl-glycoprotein beta-1,2-N-acetylglucosaminyltransferase [Fistulifera solaris]|eukprot:GAX13576.1 alpha-1,3-mannosyl-glycoprotein beta-1,2-N-acetylglucosaminyltransferase [Fistulifera solaris]
MIFSARAIDQSTKYRRCVFNFLHVYREGQGLPSKTTETTPKNNLLPYESPLIIFTYQRDNYLRDTLTDILKNIPRDCSVGCPIVLSQDGNNPAVINVIHNFTKQFAEIGIPVVHLQHHNNIRGKPYIELAVHYGWGLTQVFSNRAQAPGKSISPKRVIILEEDLHTAEDFFDYFAAMAPILDRDFTLLAVSAFNDNGYEGKVLQPDRVLRSDFFPGLGWMLTRKLWEEELQHKWPQGYWDDWLREPAQRQNRHILRPEISRTFHFGVKGGASMNQFGSRLSNVLLDQTPVDWKHFGEDIMKSLELPRYNANYAALVQAAHLETSIDKALQIVKQRDTRIEYQSFKEFQRLARALKLMDDEKAMIPRTAYKGIVETRPHGDHLLFLTPPLQVVLEALKAAP